VDFASVLNGGGAVASPHLWKLNWQVWQVYPHVESTDSPEHPKGSLWVGDSTNLWVGFVQTNVPMVLLTFGFVPNEEWMLMPAARSPRPAEMVMAFLAI